VYIADVDSEWVANCVLLRCGCLAQICTAVFHNHLRAKLSMVVLFSEMDSKSPDVIWRRFPG